METEEKIIKPRKKTGLIILIALLCAMMVYYTVMLVSGPEKKLNELSEQFIIKEDGKVKLDERIFSDSAYLALLKEKAYLQSRIAMAETDSIYLTINLPDSTINIEISGVIVHSTKIKYLEMSSILKNGNEFIISSMLSSPFTIVNEISSIEKEPLMISMAPKDTSEFQPDIMPDTADFEPVNYILEMQNGLRIHVYQEEKFVAGDGFHIFGFDLRDRLKSTLLAIKSVMVFKVPDYKPFIKVRLPRADAKIIYRAVPRNGQVAVYR
jgi:hypothetical protein